MQQQQEAQAMESQIGIDHPLKQAPAEFVDAVDHCDPLTCTRERLAQLHQAAPTPELRAWAQGILDMREMLAAVTGKEF